ncbi:MAG: sugar phosphate isomerase/epimerase family protein [Anaerolineae bacterium]|nr:sugar phosphate isomerase/epimerase family protein [Anaerolineae bacterium]
MSETRLSLGSWAFCFGPFAGDPWPFSRVLQFAAEAGYDGVEINGFRPHPHPDDYDTPDKCRELVREIAGWGLGISGYAPAFSEVPPAVVEAEDYLRLFRRCLAFCNRCGIATLRVDTVSPPTALSPAEYEARFSRLTRTWRRAAQEAAQAGVLLVWEFEPGFWLNKPSEVRRVVEAVDHENFRLLFDTSHAYMGAVVAARHTGQKETLPGGLAAYARLLGDSIGHLHLIDSDGTLHDDETSTHAAFGQGKVDFGAALTAIRPIVSRLPWWCVDFCFNPDAPTASLEAVPFVRRLMREVLT